MNIEDIARAAHEINRAYCAAIGEYQAPWDDAPEWQRESALNGVHFHLEHPHAGARASHENWLRLKQQDGWVYGAVKNADKKEHPCMVPFEELSIGQQAKDHIFHAVVHTLAAIDNQSVRLTMDYNQAKQVYSDHLAKDPTGYGRMDAALLKAFEHVYRSGVEAGRTHERDIQSRKQLQGGEEHV